jgi:hypothetical protein
MKRLTDDQVDFLADNLEKHGIEDERLRGELLDHVCVLVEVELNTGKTFEEAYQLVLQRFGNDGFRRVQNDTLEYTNYPKFITKQLLAGIGIAGATVFLTGIVLRFGHLPYKGFFLAIGVLMLCYVFMPLALMYNLIRVRDRLFALFGAVTFFLLLHAVMFRLMRLPQARYFLPFAFLVLVAFGGTALAKWLQQRKKTSFK